MCHAGPKLRRETWVVESSEDQWGLRPWGEGDERAQGEGA